NNHSKWNHGENDKNGDYGDTGSNENPNHTPTTPDKPSNNKQPGTPTGNDHHTPQPGDNSDQNKNDQNTAELSQFEQQVVTLTNQERSKQRLPALKVSNPLSNMAGVKAKDMLDNNYFDHNSPTYGSPFDMMKQFGISYSYAGENIAAGQR